jgi:NADPH2:quinone reductase
MMKAVVVHENGPAEALTYEASYPTPSITDGQVLVKNEFTGLNFIDTYFRKGGPAYTQATLFLSGQEGGGTIVEVTPKAVEAGLAVGQRVAYSVLGTYCEYTAVPAAKIVNVPDGVGLDVATACMTQGLTAHYLTNSAHAGLVKPGEWMLIHGVGGGTCQWAAQMAKLKGYKVIGTCPEGKEDTEGAKYCDELVVTKCLPGTPYEDYESVDIVSKVMDITGGAGVKAVIDGIGKSTVDISIECLSRRGIFVTFGNASGPVPAFPPIRLIKKSAFLTRPKLLDYVADRKELMWRADEIFGWLQSGDLKVAIDKEFALSDAVEGHKYLESGASKGKVLYKVD